MPLIIRRNPRPDSLGNPRDCVVIDGGRITVRVLSVDGDGTVHLAIGAGKDISIIREELLNNPSYNGRDRSGGA